MKKNDWQTLAPGIPDEYFIRGQVPMTKEEIRTITLAKAKLFPEAVVYDIGAGTGSITIEAALQAYRGRVYAYENNEKAAALIKANQSRFEVENVEIIAGTAPAGMTDLPRADAVLIGGSGGHLPEILKLGLGQLKPAGRMVINAITMETLQAAVGFAEANGLALEAITVTVSRLEKIGASHWWQARNPITIITMSRRE